MQITTILAFITAMGGLEAVKWLVRYLTCRKTDARKEEASVNSMEAVSYTHLTLPTNPRV